MRKVRQVVAGSLAAGPSLGRSDISVAMASYNGARFLGEQLESIAKQSLLPAELVVCDDRSTDSTVSVLETFAAGAPFPVTIVRNETHLGYADTFIAAALQARGAWVAFCDQDDVWFPDKLARCSEAAERRPDLALVSHSAVEVDERLESRYGHFPDWRRVSITGPLQRSFLAAFPGFSCVFRRSLIAGIPLERRPADYFDPAFAHMVHDRLVFNLANTYGAVITIPQVLTVYRRHDAAVSGTKGGRTHSEASGGRVTGPAYGRRPDFARAANYAEGLASFYLAVRKESARYRQEPEFASRTDAAIAYYQALALSFGRRVVVHDREQALSRRASAFLTLLSEGSYRSVQRGRGLGWRALARDCSALLT